MSELITFGETMAVMAPKGSGVIGEITDFSLRMAGAESNTAVGVARLGHTAGWISAVGDDSAGRYIRNSLINENVDISFVKTDKDHRTGLMLKEFVNGLTNVYYYRENSAASFFGCEDIPYSYLNESRIIHLTGITPLLSNSCFAAVNEFVRLGKEKGKLISFDPNIRLKLWRGRDCRETINTLMFSSDIVLLGRKEAGILLDTDNCEAVINILRDKGVKYIAVKDGDNGAWCADRENVFYIPPFPCDSVDPVGAGDGFNAGFLTGILESKSIQMCGKMGGIVGAMATESTGDVDGYPMRDELEKRISFEVKDI